MGPSMVVVGQHFHKRRSLANGIAASGGSIGQLVLPQLISALLARYTFQGALLVFSAFCLHALPAAALYRPHSFYGRKSKSRSRERSCSMSKGQKETQDAEDLPDIYPLDEWFPMGAMVTVPEEVDVEMDMPTICPYHEAPDIESIDESTKVKDNTPEPEQQQSPKDKRPSRAAKCCRLFDWSLFRNWLFIIYVVGLSFGNAGYVNLCMFLPPYAIDNGITKQWAAILLSITGISDLIGRLVSGWIADFEFIKRSNMIAVTLILTGISAILLPISPTFPWLVAYSITLGAIGGMYVSLMAVVAVDLLGISRLASAFGMATMCFGLALIPVPVALG